MTSPIRIECTGRGSPRFAWEVRGRPSGTMSHDDRFEVAGVEMQWRPGIETKDILSTPVGVLILWLASGFTYDAAKLVVRRIWSAAVDSGTRLRIRGEVVESEDDLLEVLWRAQEIESTEEGPPRS